MLHKAQYIEGGYTQEESSWAQREFWIHKAI
jgi:hypothetical protein